MLTSRQFDNLLVPITQLYEEYTQSVINDIARRLKNLDFASAAWQVQRLNESGALYKDILKKLSIMTGKSEKELRELFKKAGVKSMAFDDSIYKAAGLNPLPLNLSPAMAQVLAAGLRKTNGIMNNMTMTTAINAQQTFVKAADQAYLQVSTGTMSYDQAIRAAVKQLANDGLSTIDYASGHKDQLDVAMRRTVLTGIAQTTAELQLTRATEMGQDLIAVSAHVGARNVGEGPANHEGWQGKVYSRSINNTQYPNFIEKTGFGTGEGLAGWNCRHSFYPFFEGISENAYSKADLENFAGKTVTYNGRKMSVYEGTQYQRAIERRIRKHKREAGALQAAGLDNTRELAQVKNYQSVMRDFIKQTGLDRQPVRESVIKPDISAPVTAPVEIAPIAPVIEPAVPGVPVSNALDVSGVTNKKIKGEIGLALQTMDSVHGDGALPTIPITQVGAGRGNYGAFYATSSMFSNSRAIKIAIAPKGDHQAMTALHEIGHFIDHSGLGADRRWSSEANGIENNLIIKAARLSDWWTKIEERLKVFGDAAKLAFSPRYLSYLKSNKEMFARAYAQFIAMESGDPILLAQLKKLQDQTFPTQWSDKDFKPIAEEFRKLFKERGWMK